MKSGSLATKIKTSGRGSKKGSSAQESTINSFITGDQINCWLLVVAITSMLSLQISSDSGKGVGIDVNVGASGVFEASSVARGEGVITSGVAISFVFSGETATWGIDAPLDGVAARPQL